MTFDAARLGEEEVADHGDIVWHVVPVFGGSALSSTWYHTHNR